MSPAATRTLVLVEGDSDAAAVRAAAGLLGCDLEAQGAEVRSAAGVTNFSRELADFRRRQPGAHFYGLYDVADEWHVRRAVAHAGVTIAESAALEALGFFACVADLEDELIRALGPEAVERVIAGEGELDAFRRFQAMPQHRQSPMHNQLRRFLGTRATRKIRCAQRLVEAMDRSQLPRPLLQLVESAYNDMKRRSACTPASPTGSSSSSTGPGATSTC